MYFLDFKDTEGNHLYTNQKSKIYLKVYYSSEIRCLGEFREDVGVSVYTFYYMAKYSEGLKIPLNLKVIKEIYPYTILSTVIEGVRYFIDKESALKYGELDNITSFGLDVIFYVDINFWMTDITPLDLKKVSEINRIDAEIDDFVYLNC